MYKTAATPSQHAEDSTLKTHLAPKKKNWWLRFISQFSKEERSMKKGLKEVEKIRSGKLEGKTFDAFLHEVQNHPHT